MHINNANGATVWTHIARMYLDDLTFYKMEGRYFVRKKSRLTREKVLTHAAFEKTRFYAGRLVTASKIASSIYSDLPIDWRQFWMFRDFTGEAMTMIDNGATVQEAYDYLWTTYVEYWVLYQKATGITLKTGRKKQPIRPAKTYKTRLKHRTMNPKCRRYRRLIGRNHWKSNYDNTAELLEQERKRIAREKKLQWFEDQRLKERWKQDIIAAGVLRKKKTRQQKRHAIKLKPPDQLVA